MVRLVKLGFSKKISVGCEVLVLSSTLSNLTDFEESFLMVIVIALNLGNDSS